MENLKIEIVSDVVCPWCIIGFRNLKLAMDSLKDEFSFDVCWKPYELHPEIPQEGYDKKLYMEQKFGGSANAKTTYNQIEEIGKNLGFEFNFSKTTRIPNTFMAHRLIWLASSQGKQTELSESLFKAYFTDGQNIGDKQTLIKIAKGVGMNSQETEEFLASKAGGDEVAKEEMNFIEKSIGAVPTFFINDQYIIQGGQEAETFVSFLKRIALKEREKINA